MSAPVNSLIAILKEIHSGHKELLLLLEEEKRSLISHSLEGIWVTIKKKETLALKLKMLEETRKERVKEIAGAIGVPQERLTLSFLAEKSDPREAPLLEQWRERLNLLIKKIGEANRENRSFIEQSMKGIGDSFAFLNQAVEEEKTYAFKGKMAENPQGSGKVLCRQA